MESIVKQQTIEWETFQQTLGGQLVDIVHNWALEYQGIDYRAGCRKRKEDLVHIRYTSLPHLLEILARGTIEEMRNR